MAYPQFTFKGLKKAFGLSEERVNFSAEHQSIQPNKWLLETLKMGEEVAFFSEKSRSEAIVMPILLEIKRLNQRQVAVYSGVIFDVDKSKGLNGECDYILSLGEQTLELEAPIFAIIEAKDNDIEQGITQCLAQLIAARQFNADEGIEFSTLYGCSTTGVEWQFICLKGNVVYIDSRRYYLDRLEEILGVLQFIIDKAIAEESDKIKKHA